MAFLSMPELWVIYESPPPLRRTSKRPRVELKGLGLAGSIAVLLMVLAPGPLRAETAVVDTGGYRLNVRWGPGTHHAIARVLNAGDRITLSGNRSPNGWAQLADGTWVAGNLIRVVEAAPSRYQAYVATPVGYNLNIRSGPSTAYPAVNTLARGTPLTITNRYVNGWAQLTDGSWVAGNWIVVGAPLARPTPAPPPQPEPNVLRRGSQGERVMALQTRLRSLGYLPDDFIPNGQFDAATEQAVIDFQRVNGLTADGLFGAATQARLYSASAIYKPSPPGGDTSNHASNGGRRNGSDRESPAPNPDPGNEDSFTESPRQARISTDTGQEMPIFSGPGTEYVLVGYLNDGETVTLTGRMQGNWAELDNGNWAYIPWLDF